MPFWEMQQHFYTQEESDLAAKLCKNMQCIKKYHKVKCRSTKLDSHNHVDGKHCLSLQKCFVFQTLIKQLWNVLIKFTSVLAIVARYMWSNARSKVFLTENQWSRNLKQHTMEVPQIFNYSSGLNVLSYFPQV